ncbi:MAG: hypothetical protein ABGY75_11155 [Gemmataceae bacterium]
MQQLYATGTFNRADGVQTPPPGKGLRLPAVTAATGGLKADLLHSVLPHALYTPPAGGVDRLPVRLALLNTPTGRVLTHAVPTGDSYFAHALVNLPDTADAQLAIQTWGSPLWQHSAPESAGDLPELAAPPTRHPPPPPPGGTAQVWCQPAAAAAYVPAGTGATCCSPL